MTGQANGDVALALLFYGGMAGGVLLTGLAGQSASTLQGYLFGSILAISDGRRLGHDRARAGRRGRSRRVVAAAVRGRAGPEFAQVAGLNVRFYNLLVSVMAAVSVTVAMRPSACCWSRR